MKGVYTLIMRKEDESTIGVGALGNIRFKKGIYTYVGSALNGLKNRISRHLREEKSLYWHIDYLLKKSDIEEIIYAKKSEKIECEIARILSKRLEPIKHFGASDCNCKTHLFYSSDLDFTKKITRECFIELGLEPKKWDGNEQGLE